MTDITYVMANGVRFACLKEGQGPLVLLLHGFPDTAHTWDEVRPALASAGYCAVSPFMRDYFPTAIPEDGKYDSETLGRDALALISALGEERAIVVGHDWGASAAYAAAATGPERVRQMISVAIPHPASLRPLPRVLWGFRHFLGLRIPGAAARVRANDFAHVDELVHRWSPAWQVPPQETAAVKDVFRHPGCLEAALGYYRALSPVPPAVFRRRISVPSVAFSGADDGLLRREDFERARRWFTGPHEIVHMPGGHFLHREHPARFIAELLRCLATVGLQLLVLLVLVCSACSGAQIHPGTDPGTADDAAVMLDLNPVSDMASGTRDLHVNPDLSDCKTTCGGAECGPIPNGCGGTINCGDCGPPSINCITYPMPLFRDTVRKTIELVKTQHPEYFNLNDSMGGGSVKVLDKMGFVTALVADLNGMGGLVTIVDPNDDNEIRVRADMSDAAENYHVVTSKSYCGYKYTSTCMPAGF